MRPEGRDVRRVHRRSHGALLEAGGQPQCVYSLSSAHLRRPLNPTPTIGQVEILEAGGQRPQRPPEECHTIAATPHLRHTQNKPKTNATRTHPHPQLTRIASKNESVAATPSPQPLTRSGSESLTPTFHHLLPSAQAHRRQERVRRRCPRGARARGGGRGGSVSCARGPTGRGHAGHNRGPDIVTVVLVMVVVVVAEPTRSRTRPRARTERRSRSPACRGRAGGFFQ